MPSHGTRHGKGEVEENYGKQEDEAQQEKVEENYAKQEDEAQQEKVE